MKARIYVNTRFVLEVWAYANETEDELRTRVFNSIQIAIVDKKKEDKNV